MSDRNSASWQHAAMSASDASHSWSSAFQRLGALYITCGRPLGTFGFLEGRIVCAFHIAAAASSSSCNAIDVYSNIKMSSENSFTFDTRPFYTLLCNIMCRISMDVQRYPMKGICRSLLTSLELRKEIVFSISMFIICQ